MNHIVKQVLAHGIGWVLIIALAFVAIKFAFDETETKQSRIFKIVILSIIAIVLIFVVTRN